MIKNSNFSIKSILIFCLCVYFLGAESGEKISESKSEKPVITQPKEEKIWRLFGSVGFGGIFGVTDVFNTTLCSYLCTYIKEKQHYDRIYFEVDLGTEFIFKNGNGFNVFLDIDNQAFAIGANYVYELRGKYKFSFMSGFDIGKQYLPTGTYRSYYEHIYHTTVPLVRYNLGVRYRAKKQAFGINIKIPLYNTTLRNDEGNFFDSKNYAGVALSITYSYFFKL